MRPPTRPRRTAPLPAEQRPRPPVPQPARPAPGPAASRPAAEAPSGRADAPSPARSTDVAVAVTAPRSFPVRPPVVSDAAARFAERAALHRRLTRRRILWATSAVGVALALGWLLLVSPVLALDPAEVEIRGEGTVVDPTLVAAEVAAHDGTPLPRLDTVALRRDVLDVPGVRAAQVERVWPHGLRITLVSREPVAAVPRDGAFALLDVEGVQVGRTDAAPEGLPVISVPADDPGARAMTAVLTVLEQIPPELAAELATASAQSRDTVTFELRDGVVVEWGSADETALKARVLQTLRAAEPSRGARVFDVSAPTVPITTS